MPEEKSKFSQREEEISQYWQDNDIFKKTLEKDAPKGDFVFFEGPPTANGLPGIHHVIARAFKDTIPRYKTMQGYKVLRKAGWDTHGLPVELQVEKELGTSGKQDIEKLKPTVEESIEYFNKLCKESVWKYTEEWLKLSNRIAFWLDYDNPYITYDAKYIESLWWIIKQVWDKELLYQGYKVVPYCPRCGTSLSTHEVAQGYQEVEENSVYIRFKLKPEQNIIDFKTNDNTYILSWTTTPWTLPGNVGLAVGNDIDYAIVKAGSDYLIIAKARMQVIEDNITDYEIIAEVKGSDLISLEYDPLFPGAIPEVTDKYENAFKVYPADFVTIEDGTGVVHTAVMYGIEDYDLGQEVGLPQFHTVTEQGTFIDGLAQYKLAGLKVKDKITEEIIIKYLKDNDNLLAEEMYKHDYPFCWRCDTALLYYGKPSWFIKMTAVKEKLIENGDQINWVPKHIKKGRFGEWLENVKDWAFSRERYWGTPLPIWQCSSCDEQVCIGNYQELAELSGQEIDRENFDPHRPFIDKIELNCKCGQKMKRVPEVCDVWFDSGSMPFAQWYYPQENKDMIDNNKQFPADFISEAVDQTRGWFYTLLAVSTLVDKGAPYKNVICLGHIRDSKGKKMSKSKGNIVEPWYIINKYSVDALRWHLYTINAPGDYKNFDEKNVDEVIKKVILIWQNTYNFYSLYADDKIADINSENILDKWVLAKLNLLVKEVTDNLDEYNLLDSGRRIQEFINELSTWYIRRSRDRFKGDDQKDKDQALAVTHYCLLTLSKLCAPFMPFISEDIYLKLKGAEKSVHLDKWPEPMLELIDTKLLEQMETVRKIIEQALAVRTENGLKIRQPLAKLYITKKSLPQELFFLIKDEVNVKEIEVVGDLPQDDNVKIGVDENYKVGLDIAMTEDLKIEGHARELIRQINSLRKKQGLSVGDLVELEYQTDSAELKKVIEKLGDLIKTNTLTKELIEEEGDEEFTINGEKILISIKK